MRGRIALKISFDQIFKPATGHEQGPFDYQCRLACGERNGRAESEWLSQPHPADGCRSRLINIPTGLDKTTALVVAWLWNRVVPSINSQFSILRSCLAVS